MRPKLAVTLTDVAEKAGVSIATVSRILNEVGSANPDTVERVRKAVRETGYRVKPKAAAAGGRPGRVDAPLRVPISFLRVGEFNPELQSPVTHHLEMSLQQAAKAQGHAFTSHMIPDPGKVKLREVIGKAEGVILRTSNNEDVDRETLEGLEGLPAVQVLGESRTGRYWFDHLGPDNAQAGALAADYLLSRGCKKLVFASTNTRNRNVGLERCATFVKYATAAGVECQVVFQALAPDRDRIQKALDHLPAEYTVFKTRNELIRDIAAKNPKPFGLFVPTDLELSVIMPQLEMLGVDFHKHCAAIGCDRELRCFTGLDPQPATMDLHIDNLAERAIRRLRYRMENPDESLVRILVSPEVVVPGA